MKEPHCETITDLLPEFTAGVLDGPSAAMVRAHLAECGDCRGEAELVGWLRARVELPAGLEERVVNAVHAGAVRRAPRWGLKHYAMAATVSFATLTGSWIWQNSTRERDPAMGVTGAVAADEHVLRSPGLSALSEEELLALLKEIES